MPTWAGQSYQALQQQPRRKLQRQANPRRSSSFLGALKSIVSAPLTWFGSDEDFESEVGINGKRQRNASGGATQARQELQTTGRAQPEDVDDAPRAKRPRVEDPQPEPKRPYLDPPGLAFTNHLQYGPRGTAHGATGVNGISRTMPVDPRASAPPSPSPMREMSAASAEGEVANASGSTFARASTWMHSAPPAPGPISRDYSMPPVGGTPSTRPQAPFRMRSSFSLTPQPSGQGFGPRIHRERGHSEQPPPLADLMANPVFLQPPSEEPATHGLAPGGHRRSMSLQPTLTLGTIAEQRSRSPLRQQNTFIIDPYASGYERSGSSLAREYTPTNPAEKALHELDVYKTPLLPTRLRLASSTAGEGSSAAVPDMFRHSKVHVPVPMRRRKGEGDDKPLLGMKPKTSPSAHKEAQANHNKPYAGQGGIKKLLARRRIEEEEERVAEEDDADNSMEGQHDEKDEPVKQPAKKAAQAAAIVVEDEDTENKKDPFDLPPPEVPFTAGHFNPLAPSAPSAAPSSLRVGRAKTERNRDRMQRPQAGPPRKSGAARFTAAMDEDDESMEAPEVAKETPKPLFTPPAGFSFAPPTQVVQETPKKQEMTDGDEAPIASLPFSLGAKPSPVSAFTVPPTIALVPPTPEASKDSEKDTKAGSAVPNFFANSNLFKKPPVATPPAVPVAGASIFGGGSGGAVFGSASAASASSKEGASNAENKPWTAGPTSVFGAPAAEKSKVEAPASVFGSKPSESSAPVTTTSAFSFGPSAPATKVTEGAAPAPFSFGAPAPAKTSEEQLKPAHTPELHSASATLFGSSLPTPTALSTPVAEVPKPVFSFGAPSATPAPATTPAADANVLQAPFGASPSPAPFSFGQPTKTTAEPKEGATKAPFAFGAPPATPPAVMEKKASFSFGGPAAPIANAAPAAPASGSGFSFSFGAPASNAAPDASKSFSFGSNTTAAPGASLGSTIVRPVTPPKKEDDEIQMDESPTRGGSGMDLYGNGDAPKAASTPFSFGSGPPSGSTLFGSTPGPAVAPPPITTSFSFGASNPPTATTPASNGFSFGQKKPEVRASSGGFSFGPPKQEAPAAPSSAFNFGQKADVPAATPGAFSFGQKADTPPTSGGFSFGQPKVDTPAVGNAFSFGPKPGHPTPAPALTTSFSAGSQSSATPFSFGGPASAPPTSAPAFSFGAAASTTGFGQPASNPGSAPGSPSTFAQATPFGFNSPTIAPANPFSFGVGSSQPASPAVASAGLPGAGGSGFSFGQGPVGTPPTSSHGAPPPFGAPAAPAGGALFNIGAAPPPPAGGGPRAMKKMPARRKR